MGDSRTSRSIEQTINIMFERSVHDHSTDCWLWLGCRNNKGYGLIWCWPQTWLVHRLSFVHFTGPIKEIVCHTCDTPNCWNPSHLFDGTHLDNAIDRADKGHSLFGERNHHAKLTTVQVVEIRASKLNNQELATMYGVGKTTISNIRNRQRWRHI